MASDVHGGLHFGSVSGYDTRMLANSKGGFKVHSNNDLYFVFPCQLLQIVALHSIGDIVTLMEDVYFYRYIGVCGRVGQIFRLGLGSLK